MVFANFYDRELDEISFKNAKQSIGETTEARSKGLQILKTKLTDVDDLNPRLDDEFLLRYLRVAKFDANKAFERLRKYYTVKAKYTHIFDKFYPSAIPSALNAHHFSVSPKRTADNSAIIIHKRGLLDLSTLVFEEIFALDALILDYLGDNPLTQMCGTTNILDFQGYGFQTMLQDTPRRMHMVIDTLQNSFPFRFNVVHVINAPTIISVLYNICHPFMTKKLKSRLHVHYKDVNWKSLHAAISPELLPETYGGSIPDSHMIDLSHEVLKKDKYFKEQLQYGYIKAKK